jgi:hypothetical protein
VKLLNVRLSEADARRVHELRQEGVVISELLRESIRREHERLKRRPLKAADVDRVFEEIDAKHPLPKNLPPQEVDPTDRKAVHRYLVRRLKRRRNHR